MKEITDQTLLEVVSSNNVVLVEIGSPGCGPCKTVKKSCEELEEEYAEKVVFCSGDMMSGDVDDLCMKYRVMSAPTLLFFKAGEMVEKIAGGAPKKADIAKKIDALL